MPRMPSPDPDRPTGSSGFARTGQGVLAALRADGRDAATDAGAACLDAARVGSAPAAAGRGQRGGAVLLTPVPDADLDADHLLTSTETA